MERWAGRVLPQAALAALVPVAALAVIVVRDPLSAVLLAPTLPLLIVFLVLAGGDAKRVADRRFAAMSLLGAHLLDVTRGLPVLRSLGRAEVQRDQLALAGEAYRRETVATLRSAFVSSFALEFIAMLGTALVAVVAGVRLVNGTMAFEDALVVLLLAPEMYGPLRRAGVEYHAAAEARATLKRLLEVTDGRGRIVPGTPGGVVADPRVDAIVLEDVTVTADDERVLLEDLSLEIAPGEATAIVGPSGAGKSTLLRVLLGLQPVRNGTVRCGDVELGRDGPRRVARGDRVDAAAAGAAAGDAGGEPAARRPGRARRAAVGGARRRRAGGVGGRAARRARGAAGRGRRGCECRRAAAHRARAHRTARSRPGPRRRADREPRRGHRRARPRRARAHRRRPHRGARHPRPRGRGARRPDDRAGARGGARMIGAGTLRGWWSGAAPRERAALATAVALATAAALATPALLGLSGYLLARAAEQPDILTLAVAIVGVRFFGLLRAAARYAERLVTHDVALARLGRVRVAVFEALIPRVPGRLGGRTSADAAGRGGGGRRPARRPAGARAGARGVEPARRARVRGGGGARAAGGGALLALVLVLQVVFLALTAGRDAEVRSAARAELSGELVTLLDAAPELVAWGAAEAYAARVERAGRRVDRLTAAAARAASAAGATTILAAGAGALAMLAVTVPAAADGRIGGVMVAALALLALGAAEVGRRRRRHRGGEARGRGRGRAAGAAGRARRRSAGGTGRPQHGGVAVRGLTLERGGRRILDRVDLDIEPGERVALTGASGVGKSTLADVLAGFAEPSAGEVRAGGVELADMDGAALRETVRWIPQDPHIFATTIAANVRIAAPEADDETLDAALRAVGAGPWLDSLPDGLATRLGEFGERCSGGERQRIGLARAHLCGGALLLLDEPASHLPHDEALEALSAVMDAAPGRGVLLVTHRREEVALAAREVRLGA